MPRPRFGQGNPSDEPTAIAMGELENISSGKMWASVAERDANAKFDLVWNEPTRPTTNDEGRMFLAVARSLYDRGTLVSQTKIARSEPRVPAPFIEINSQDAEQIGIENNVRVRVSFDSRVIELNARVNGRVPPGVVLIPNNLEGTIALPMGAWVRLDKV
jgi:anaerobic selenocysteine-containing dehydrogenase